MRTFVIAIYRSFLVLLDGLEVNTSTESVESSIHSYTRIQHNHAQHTDSLEIHNTIMHNTLTPWRYTTQSCTTHWLLGDTQHNHAQHTDSLEIHNTIMHNTQTPWRYTTQSCTTHRLLGDNTCMHLNKSREVPKRTGITLSHASYTHITDSTAKLQQNTNT